MFGVLIATQDEPIENSPPIWISTPNIPIIESGSPGDTYDLLPHVFDQDGDTLFFSTSEANFDLNAFDVVDFDEEAFSFSSDLPTGVTLVGSELIFDASAPSTDINTAVTGDGSGYLTTGTATDFDFDETQSFCGECKYLVLGTETSFKTLIGKGDTSDNAWILYYNHNLNAFSFYLQNTVPLNATVTSQTVSPGWYQVAFNVNRATNQIHLYIDGIEVSNSPINIPHIGTLTTIDPLSILWTPNAAWSASLGAIDDVRIWNTVRTENEIFVNRNRAIEGTPDNLIGYWKMDGTVGTGATTITDESSSPLVSLTSLNGSLTYSTGDPYTYEVYVSDGFNTPVLSPPFTIQISSDIAPTATSIPNPLFTGQVSDTYDFNQDFSDDGVSPITWTITGTLGPGLSLNSSTGILSYNGIGGISNNSHTVRATDAVGFADSQSFIINVSSAILPDVYVWTGGNNTTGDSWTNAKTSIAGGLIILESGGIMLVREGTYSASLGDTPSGSFGNYTVIRANPGDTVNLTPTGSPGFLRIGTFSNDSYIEVDGFVCTDSANYDAFKIDGSGHHIRIQNCTISNCESKGILDSTASGSTGYCEFINNNISNVGSDTQDHCIYTTSDNNTIWGNTLTTAAGYGLQIFDDSRAPSNNNVQYNFIYNNSRGIVSRGSNNYIANNIVSDNDVVGINILNFGGDSGIEIYNNTIYSTSSGSAISNNVDNTQIKNNIMWQNSSNITGSGSTVEATNLTTDPSFVVGSPVNAVDFQVNSGSNALDAGTTVSSVTNDFLEVPRPQGGAYDIGAYEKIEAVTAEYFVAQNHPNASDNNPGTEGLPFETIGRGIQALSGGQVLEVAAGTYINDAINNPPSGSVGNYTIVRVKDGDEAIINFTSLITGQNGISVGGTRHHIEIDGFTIGQPGGERLVYNGCKLDVSSHHIRVQNCTFWYTHQSAVLTAPGTYAPGPNFAQYEILNNTFWYCGHPGDNQDHAIYLSKSWRCKVWGNEIIDAGGYGIQLWYSTGFEQYNSENDIQYNIVRNATSSSGGALTIRGHDNLIANNLVYDNNIPSGGALWDYQGSERNKYYNNTVFNNGSAAGYNRGVDTEYKNNIFWGNGSDSINVVEGNIIASNNHTGNPTFVNEGTRDLRLGTGSTAIDAGGDLSPDVTDDFIGTPRPQGIDWDIGAYEYNGADFFVNKTGDDSDGKTETTAYNTIAKGLNALSSGQILQIGAGTYTDEFIESAPSGTNWNNPTVIQAKSGETVVIDSSAYSSSAFAIDISSGSYIIFDGLTLGNDGVRNTHNTVRLEGTCHHIRVQNCEIRWAEYQGINYSGSGGGGVEVLNCDVHHNGLNGIGGRENQDHGIYMSAGQDHIISGNDVHDNKAYGIHFWKSTAADLEAIITKNRCWGQNNRSGITYKGTNGLIANNICWDNSGGINLDGGTTNTKAYHNTVYNNDRGTAPYGIRDENAGSNGNEIRNNIAYINSPNIGPGGATVSNNVTTDPSFAAPSANDFHLTSSSTNCIDQGFDVFSDVPDDFDGEDRDTSPDIGAYKFV
jgi:hypothetical protein